MSSQRKIKANRPGSPRSSGGPTTAAGKRKSSRNSRKHGLAGLRQPGASADIERLAVAFCGEPADPAVLAQARIVAENEVVLRAVRSQQLSAVERLRDPTTMPLAGGKNGRAKAQGAKKPAQRPRDEYEAMEAAMPDLIRLERYERRAWSRYSRSILALVNAKFARDVVLVAAGTNQRRGN